MSGNVGSDISNSGMVANVGVAVGIAYPSISVLKLFPFRFPLQVSWPTFAFRCRPMSDNVGSVKLWSGIVENVGLAIGIASISVSVQKLCPLPVSWTAFALLMSADVGQCGRCQIRVGHGRKCWGKN